MSYTRFSLARQVDGDNSHVEMKLAADEEENVDSNMRGNQTSVTKPKRLNGYICYGIIAVIIFFLIGKNSHSKLKKFLVVESKKFVQPAQQTFM